MPLADLSSAHTVDSGGPGVTSFSPASPRGQPRAGSVGSASPAWRRQRPQATASTVARATARELLPSRAQARAGVSGLSSWDLEPVDFPRVALVADDHELRGRVVDGAAVIKDLADRPAVIAAVHGWDRVVHGHAAASVADRAPGDDAVAEDATGGIEIVTHAPDRGEDPILPVEDYGPVSSLRESVRV